MSPPERQDSTNKRHTPGHGQGTDRRMQIGERTEEGSKKGENLLTRDPLRDPRQPMEEEETSEKSLATS